MHGESEQSADEYFRCPNCGRSDDVHRTDVTGPRTVNKSIKPDCGHCGYPLDRFAAGLGIDRHPAREPSGQYGPPMWFGWFCIVLALFWLASGFLPVNWFQLTLAVLYGILALLWLLPTVRVGPDGIAIRRIVRWRRVPWFQVAEVEEAGRWATSVSVVLQDGDRLSLRNVPGSEARRLRDSLAASRTAAADEGAGQD